LWRRSDFKKLALADAAQHPPHPHHAHRVQRPASHLAISLMAMTHMAAAVPRVSYACDTHDPWQDVDVIQGGWLAFEGG
jgi:L-alanine-DL-glutamate epimerase-like enolase superfamily enzyme